MDRRLLNIAGLTALGVAMVVVILFLFADRPVDTAAHALKGGAWYVAATYLSYLAQHDFFKLLLFVGFIAGGILALSRGQTQPLRLLLYCCLAVTVTMLLGETLKWFFGHYRPEMLFSQGLYGFSWFAAKGKMHSFPSGHTFRIFAAMTALALVWPRAAVPFAALAVAVGVSRVVVTRHYPSDIVAGAFVGIFCALWV